MAAAEHDYVVYQRGEVGDSDAWDDTVLIKAYDNAVSAMKAKLAEQHPEFSVSQSGSKSKKKKKSKGKSKKKKSHSDISRNWNPGDLCRAVYTEDGELYEARVLSVAEDQVTCLVQYIGYGNEEEQLLSNLIPIEIAGSSQEHKTDTASETESVTQVSAAQDIRTGKSKSKKSPSHRNHAHSTQHPPKWPWGRYPQPPAFSSMPQSLPSHFAPFTPSAFPGYQASGPSMPIPQMQSFVPPPPPLFTGRGSDEDNEALYSMLISWYMSGYHTGYYQWYSTEEFGCVIHSVHTEERCRQEP